MRFKRREIDRRNERRCAKSTAPNTYKAKLCQVTWRIYFLTDIVTWIFDKSITTTVVVSGDVIDERGRRML